VSPQGLAAADGRLDSIWQGRGHGPISGRHMCRHAGVVARVNIVNTESAGFSVSRAPLGTHTSQARESKTTRVRCGRPRAGADLLLHAVSHSNTGISLVTVERARTPLKRLSDVDCYCAACGSRLLSDPSIWHRPLMFSSLISPPRHEIKRVPLEAPQGASKLGSCITIDPSQWWRAEMRLDAM